MTLTLEKLLTLFTNPGFQEEINTCKEEGIDFTVKMTSSETPDHIQCEWVTGIGGFTTDVPRGDFPSALVVATRMSSVHLSSNKDQYELRGLTESQMAMLRPRIAVEAPKHNSASKRSNPKRTQPGKRRYFAQEDYPSEGSW